MYGITGSLEPILYNLQEVTHLMVQTWSAAKEFHIRMSTVGGVSES
jgi:hypothetical protein